MVIYCWSRFCVRNFLFGAIKLLKNTDFGKQNYSEYSIDFDSQRRFSLFDCGGIGKNVIMVGVDMSSLAHIDNKKKIYFDSWERTKKWFR